MKLRIKTVAKAKGIDLLTLSKKLGISYQALNGRMKNNISMKILQETADAINCPVIELIVPDKGFVHLYDHNGNYCGIGKG